MLAGRATHMDDPDLFSRAISTICEPLERGSGIAPPPVYLKAWLGPVVNELVSEVNKAVVGISAKLIAGETHRVMCSSLVGEVRDLTASCKRLESSKQSLRSQLEKARKQGKSQVPK